VPWFVTKFRGGETMICVECGQPVNDLHHQFRGSGIRLTRCEYCKCVADKYVEHEGVIIFLDLVLHKPQVAQRPRLLAMPAAAQRSAPPSHAAAARRRSPGR